MAGPPVNRCTSYQPEVMCASRRAASAVGEIFYSVHRRGWIYPAENRAVPKSLVTAGIPPAIWRHCPFCGGALPDAEIVVRKLLDKAPNPFPPDDDD